MLCELACGLEKDALGCGLGQVQPSPRYEAHLTLHLPQGSSWARFQDTCAALGVRPLLIELERGEHPHQPMTCSTHTGTLERVWAEVQALAVQLERAGYAVLRRKLEAAPWNPEVPRTDVEAVGRGGYFEGHLKLEREIQHEDGALSRVCLEHGAHLSRNPFRRLEGGREQRFVTLRLHGVGRETAQGRLEALAGALEGQGRILKHILEYCVYDDHIELDRGWLDDGIHRSA